MTRSRVRSALLAALLFGAACSSAPRQSQVPPRSPALADTVEFLVASAATDFHSANAPMPRRFRNVRAGHVPNPGSADQYLMCGEFRSQQDDAAVWVPFATIKTSKYEQWVGGQANGFCANVQWDTGDISAELQSRVESLR